MARKLTELRFDNTYARLPGAFHVGALPTPIINPHLVSFNKSAAELIELDSEESHNSDFVGCFSGAKLLPGMEPLAMLYAGHQFGTYVPQLGDGRAILLGEVRNTAGEKWDLHLKGAGPTAFSRGFDGRAVLRSTIREYLCSEAMHHLGIPTSRALCIISSDEAVSRETIETAAVLVRMAPSHVRFGSFEVFYYNAQHELVAQLADYVINHYFPDLVWADNKYASFLVEVVRRTAHLIAKWQSVGFAHGVMNTDNMSILGITLDYGPFGFMDDYDPGFICNHSDYSGRYAFNQQPSVGLWNLSRLAQALLPLISKAEALTALDLYQSAFDQRYGESMRMKLGLREHLPEDGALLIDLLEILQTNGVDYTNFFRALGDFKVSEQTSEDARGNSREALRDKFIDPTVFDAWSIRYRARLAAEHSDDAERKHRMDEVNPKYLLRNYLAENAISQAVKTGDYSETNRLLQLLRKPYAEQLEHSHYAAAPPDWGKKLVVSCSS